MCFFVFYQKKKKSLSHRMFLCYDQVSQTCRLQKKRAKVDKVKNGTIESNMFANGVLGLR